MQIALAYPPDPTQVRALPRNAVHDMIEAFMASLDERDGDSDLEPEEDRGADDDGENRTYVEGVNQAAIGKLAQAYAEHDDDAEDCDPREDDDPGGCQHDDREPDYDDEREQMTADVPCVRVFAIEPSPFDGKRELLGYSGNNLPAFISGGARITAA